MLPPTEPRDNYIPGPPSIHPAHAGSVTLDKTGPFEAGSYQTITLTYAAGRYGIDDTGSLKIVTRFANDQGQPQFEKPGAPNYVTVHASNNAVLDVRFAPKLNTRPYDKTILIRVVKGYLRVGETITVVFGELSGGSPGFRMQTFIDPFTEFRVLADPIAVYQYVLVPDQPTFAIVAGAPQTWHAVLPTRRGAGEPFALGIRADDRWGNPSDCNDRTVQLRANRPVMGLPGSITFGMGDPAVRIDGLKVDEPGTVEVSVLDDAGATLATSNPLVIASRTEFMPYWADLHAQSAETIGSRSARDYFVFARDIAFIDAVSHQGNDFQITQEFWSELNALMAEFDEAGRFVAIPGYEWSGNTGLGGDRNVFFRTEDRAIRRSSHALVPDHSDIALDAWNARELFRSLHAAKEDAICFAHVGGRYADIRYAHDHWYERSVEVHSSWGTFEWLVADAFGLGYRVGIVANSDGHKGRPGSEPPGASQFGALGGLTCYLLPELTRDAMFEALRQRRHYATTGCRVHLDVRVTLDEPAQVFRDDPRIEGASSTLSAELMMGAIAVTREDRGKLHVEVNAAAAIESLEIRNGTEVLDVIRPHARMPLGGRVRILWSGAEYRGRGRQTIWDGRLVLEDNSIRTARPINFFNPDRRLRQISDRELAWESVTTGNFSGFDLWLTEGARGRLRLETPHASLVIEPNQLSYQPSITECGGLDRRLRVYRLPDSLSERSLSLDREVAIHAGRDNPILVCATLQDGHQAWSSPIYLVPEQA